MKPGLWAQLSRELYNKGYRFPEMLEFKTATEFPNGFVKPYWQQTYKYIKINISNIYIYIFVYF